MKLLLLWSWHRMEQWYVIHSKPHCENLLWNQLGLRNIEVYFPRLRVKTVNPRSRKVQPYFPGYLFVHADLVAVGRSALEWIPGGSGLVAFGGEPAVVAENFILSLRQRLAELDTAERETSAFRNGDRVRIQSGVFTGYEAIFDTNISGQARVRVLLALLCSRQIPVVLPADCVGYAE